MKYLVILLPLLVMTGGYHYAQAETLFLEPRITLEQEYTDNILFTRNSEEKDFITTISPAFLIKQKSPRLNGNLMAEINSIFYQDFDELDSVDKRGSGDLNYRFSERFTLGASAGYLEDSRTDREVGETGLILTGDRKQIRGGLSGQYHITEITALSFSAGYTTEDIEAPDNEGNDSISAQLTLSRNISKWFANTTAIFNIGYTTYTSDYEDVRQVGYDELPDDVLIIVIDEQEGDPQASLLQSYYADSTSDVWSLTAGFSRDLTERFSFFMKAGTSCILSDESSRFSVTADQDTVIYDAQNDYDAGTTWGWLLFSGMSYLGEYDRISLDISRDVRAASGMNGTTERSAISVGYTRRITDKLSTDFSGSTYLNQRERETTSDIDELTYNAAAGATWLFLPTWRASLNWKYTRLEDRETDLSRERNVIWARVVKTFEL
ncbi:hypothetical protein [Desulfamplus magnetovallimortis]|uniref:hypothetical protein n=1 Tax=Desulfamplus magnetovallimortis TaxID=1246637 RepID=UPI00111AF31C|nr:hypothetical protein [Desulfamplus magnetovallimortis]